MSPHSIAAGQAVADLLLHDRLGEPWLLLLEVEIRMQLEALADMERDHPAQRAARVARDPGIDRIVGTRGWQRAPALAAPNVGDTRLPHAFHPVTVLRSEYLAAVSAKRWTPLRAGVMSSKCSNQLS
jgi:hypothetical protein